MSNAKVEIVWDGMRRKLRARAVNIGGWVRFPNHLRQEGAIYNVQYLQEAKAGSWIATGSISRVK